MTVTVVVVIVGVAVVDIVLVLVELLEVELEAIVELVGVDVVGVLEAEVVLVRLGKEPKYMYAPVAAATATAEKPIACLLDIARLFLLSILCMSK